MGKVRFGVVAGVLVLVAAEWLMVSHTVSWALSSWLAG